MITYWFELLIAGPIDLDAASERLYAICDDGQLAGAERGGSILYSREANSATEAILSAIEDTERAGLVVLDVAGDLVTVEEISEKTGRSVAAVGHWITGKRGGGEFPHPVVERSSKVRLYSWAQVSRWLTNHGLGGVDLAAVEVATVAAEISTLLSARRVLRAASDERRELLQRILSATTMHRRELSGRGTNAPSEQRERLLERIAALEHDPAQQQLRDVVTDVDSEAEGAVAEDPQLGRVIRELSERDAFELEVHRAIAVPDTASDLVPVLPTYLERSGFDDWLREAVAAANRRSKLVLVVGDSSTGKTRACWEAIRAELPDWRVWHPLTPERPSAMVEAIRNGWITGRTVIWLNEAQLYLQPPEVGEEAAVELQALLADPSYGPVLVLGSLWPEYFHALTKAPHSLSDRDSHKAARALLNQATVVNVPRAFTHQRLEVLAKAIQRDPRLAAAADQIQTGQLTQYLAGAPDLLRRYEMPHSATSTTPGNRSPHPIGSLPLSMN